VNADPLSCNNAPSLNPRVRPGNVSNTENNFISPILVLEIMLDLVRPNTPPQKVQSAPRDTNTSGVAAPLAEIQKRCVTCSGLGQILTFAFPERLG
jgi:hypothetical protein